MSCFFMVLKISSQFLTNNQELQHHPLLQLLALDLYLSLHEPMQPLQRPWWFQSKAWLIEYRYSRDPRLGMSKMRQPQRLDVPSQETFKQPSSYPAVRHSLFKSYDTAAQNPMNRAFKVPHQGKQPQVDMDVSPQLRTPVQAEVPANEFSMQDSSHSSSPNSSTKSYGIFYSQQVDPMPESAPAESNRYSKRNPSDSAISQSTTVVSPYKIPPAPEGRWVRFNTDSSSTLIPNKNESQAETQKR